MIDAALRAAVRQRAEFRCEYCQLEQEQAPFTGFHVEHVIPRKHGGPTELANLALACDRCNLHKGSNLAGLDPETTCLASLFNPRTQRWDEHFFRAGPRILGRTATGRATVAVLCFNSPRRLRLRSGLLGGRIQTAP